MLVNNYYLVGCLLISSSILTEMSHQIIKHTKKKKKYTYQKREFEVRNDC